MDGFPVFHLQFTFHLFAFFSSGHIQSDLCLLHRIRYVENFSEFWHFLVFSSREIHDYHNSEDNRTSAIDCLLVLDESQIPGELVRSATRVMRVSSSIMEKLSGVETSESTEAVAVMRMPITFIDVNDDKHSLNCRRWFPLSHRILVLDAIQVIIFFFFM